MVQTPRHPAQVTLHQRRIAHVAARRLHDVSGHHGGEQAGDHQRDEDGDGGRNAEGREILSGNPANEGGRQKDGGNGERSGDDRQPDFLGSFHRRVIGRLTHAKMPGDVFDFDDGIIDQHPHHQRNRQKRHGVERIAKQLHAQKCRDDGQRQGRRRNHRCPPVAQKEPDNDDRDERAFVEQIHRALVIVISGLIGVVDLLDGDLRMRRAEFFERGIHGIGHIDFHAALAARDFKTDHRLAIDQGDGRTVGVTIPHTGDVSQMHGAAIGQRNGQRGQVFGAGSGCESAKALHGSPHPGASARGIELDAFELLRDFRRAHAQGRHAYRIEVYAHFAVDAADALEFPDAMHTQHRA